LHLALYASIKKPYLQKGIAMRLGKCQELLTAIDSSLHLMIYDAVRPLSVQRKMWLALDSIPIAQRVKYVADPKHKSMHNYGAAVDLTICNSDNISLDMGAGFDDFNPIAYPALEGKFYLNGDLTADQIANRKLLRRVMGAQGFVNLPTEWWHFDACPRKFAQLNYKVLEVEP
jgi:D-alanyl-D-alanine dipeptidase